MQTTSKILMVRPARFAFNEETAENNYFQIRSELSDQESEKERIAEEAIKEFDAFVNLLRANDVDVTVVQDTPDPYTPDSIFPNNWFSSHFSGELVRSEEHTSELQSRENLVCRLLLEKKKSQEKT